MVEDAQSSEEYQEQEPPSPEEIASITDVMLAMMRTAKGLRIYLPNNPVLIKFVQDLSGKMVGHLEKYGDIKLTLERFAMRYKGTYVYENHDPRESMAFRIYSDGISALQFSQGLRPHEMIVFLEIVGIEQQGYQDDDIVTRLWEKGLPHISYLLEEDFLDTDWEEDEEQRESQQEAITRIFKGVMAHHPTPLKALPRQLLMLTAEEADWLRKVKQVEAQRKPIDDVINILCATLAGVKNPGIFKDFIEIMNNLTINMFLAGNIGQVLRLVRFLDKLLTLGNLPPEQVQLVTEALTGILSEKSVEVLQTAIDTSETVSNEELRELLQILGLPSLGAICELLGRVEKLKTRKVIIEVLVDLGQADPHVFSPFLGDPRWYLVRNVVLVLSLLGTPVALEMIAGLITHKEARIRKEVLGFLERSPDPKAKNYILKFFRDESSALRIKAMQVLAREKQAFALKPTLALITASDFKTKELAEKKAIYEAIGELGSGQVIHLFREMLLKKRWFSKGVDKETATLAVAGLLKMRNSPALQLLEEARELRNVEIRAIVEQAIAVLSAGQGRSSADPEEV